MNDLQLQTCGRRIKDAGPWERTENIDHWRVNSWNPTGETIDYPARIRTYGPGLPEPPPYEPLEGNRWQWSWQPRTCSFCGGIHPDDAYKLLDEGWEVDMTTKRYKVYLMPPGSHQRNVTLMHQLSGPNPDEAIKKAPSIWYPTPQVKVYAQHFTDDELSVLNQKIGVSIERMRGA